MSRPAARTVALVVDASIARAAGAANTDHPRGQLCREFLMAVRGSGHRLALADSGHAEWQKHASGFALTWLVAMTRLGNVVRLADEEWKEFRDAIAGHLVDDGVRSALTKDAHLIEAANRTDQRVASLDDAVRGHLRGLAAVFTPIGVMVWANPTNADDEAAEWVRAGAPDRKALRLGRTRRGRQR